MVDDRTYEDGFREGWEGIAGDAAPSPDPVYPPEGEVRDYNAGYLYGRSEAATRFTPGSSPKPVEQ